MDLSLLSVEPLCARFLAAAPNHPEALLARPEAFEAVGENTKILRYPNNSYILYIIYNQHQKD